MISALASPSTKSTNAARVVALWRFCGAVLIPHFKALASRTGCMCQKAFLICFCVLIIAGSRVATSNRGNLPSGESLSINKMHRLKNKLLFFPCQARKPYNHKGFTRFQAEKLSGKNFPPGRQFRRLICRKAKLGIARWYVP